MPWKERKAKFKSPESCLWRWLKTKSIHWFIHTCLSSFCAAVTRIAQPGKTIMNRNVLAHGSYPKIKELPSGKVFIAVSSHSWSPKDTIQKGPEFLLALKSQTGTKHSLFSRGSQVGTSLLSYYHTIICHNQVRWRRTMWTPKCIEKVSQREIFGIELKWQVVIVGQTSEEYIKDKRNIACVEE